MKLDIQKFATGGVIMNIVKEYTYEQELKETVKIIATPDNSETEFDFQNDFTCSIDDEGWTSTGENGSYYKIFNTKEQKTVTFTYLNNDDPNYKIIGDIDIDTTDLHKFYNLTICVDKQSMTNPSPDLKKYNIKLLAPLRSYLDAYDQFIMSDDGKYKVIRNIEKYNGSLRKLKTPIEETIGKLEITLFEGTNYFYIENTGKYLMNVQYLTNSKLNKTYATKMELNSKLEQTVEGFTLTVSKKVDNDEIISTINQSAEQVKINADKISLTGKEIDLTGDEIIIKSNNFNVDEDGKIKSTSGEIGGYSIGADKLTADIIPPYDYTKADKEKVMKYIMKEITLTPEEIKKYDLTGDGKVTTLDYVKIYKFVESNTSSTSPGKVIIDSKDATHTIVLRDGNGTERTRVSMIDISTDQLYATNASINNLVTDNLTNNSDERLKKDIKTLEEKYINLLKQINPVSFKYKSSGTEHIGFIAQEVEKAFKNNNLPQIPITKDDFGYYSLSYLDFVGILWKINQNLSNQITQLEKRVSKLEGEVNE